MSSQILSKPLPYLALILAHIIWGANFVIAKITLQEFPPMSLAFLRFALAALCLVPFFIAETKKIKIKKKHLPQLVLVGILMITLNITFFFQGVVKTTAINSATLTLIIPVLSVLSGWIFLKEKVYLINILGIVCGLLGALIITGVPQFFIGNLNYNQLMGNILIILASISWVAGAIVSRQMLKIYPSLVVTAIAFLVGAVTFILPAGGEYLSHPTWPQNISMLGVFGLIYMTILSSISAYFLFEWGLAKTSVTAADLFQYIEPFVATIMAVLILAERVSTSFLIGAVLAAVGMYLGVLAKEAHHRHRVHRH